MAGHRPFRELLDKLPAKRRARIDARVRREFARIARAEQRARRRSKARD